MIVVESLEKYLSTCQSLQTIQRKINVLTWSLTKDRFDWEKFDEADIRSKIIQLEIEKKNIFEYEVKSLGDFLSNLSTNFILYSNKETETIIIHRENCNEMHLDYLYNSTIFSNESKNEVESFKTFKNAVKRAEENCHLLQVDWHTCNLCKPYFDVKKLNAEIKIFLEKI